ncbi:hypothetical protein GCM10011371_33370 [Novosphingobium marinum]|uniref:DUF3606 domain-containing protein n=1 Tax=Novosphingobium marinum TaxID=1514948 RepID=A0A7Y9XZ09_9SPHN|nr:hypothetical protein [Novosphingobium marinum]GGC43234.1 hypothetical protein GCM10011371_33370 [Novosphingobium marinum]
MPTIDTKHPNSGKTYSGIGYNVTYFARKHGISQREAKDLMRRFGHDRDSLNKAAVELGNSKAN